MVIFGQGSHHYSHLFHRAVIWLVSLLGLIMIGHLFFFCCQVMTDNTFIVRGVFCGFLFLIKDFSNARMSLLLGYNLQMSRNNHLFREGRGVSIGPLAIKVCFQIPIIPPPTDPPQPLGKGCGLWGRAKWK